MSPDLAAWVLSPAFVVAALALIKRYAKAGYVTGPRTAALALGIAVLAQIASVACSSPAELASNPVDVIIQSMVKAVVVTLVVLGGDSYLQRIAAKIGNGGCGGSE